MTVTGKCDVPRCSTKGIIVYYGKDVCKKHWDWHCNDKKTFDLKKVLKIRGSSKKE